jgi:hypothetical protein
MSLRIVAVVDPPGVEPTREPRADSVSKRHDM